MWVSVSRGKIVTCCLCVCVSTQTSGLVTRSSWKKHCVKVTLQMLSVPTTPGWICIDFSMLPLHLYLISKMGCFQLTVPGECSFKNTGTHTCMCAFLQCQSQHTLPRKSSSGCSARTGQRSPCCTLLIWISFFKSKIRTAFQSTQLLCHCF